jgi:hypothetical protein
VTGDLTPDSDAAPRRNLEVLARTHYFEHHQNHPLVLAELKRWREEEDEDPTC